MDFVHRALTFLTFQRDPYVEIPAISAHSGITYSKLDQEYFYGNPGIGNYDGPSQGPRLLAVTLNLNFGTGIDHFAAVNYQTFVRVVDTLGGIDIDLPTMHWMGLSNIPGIPTAFFGWAAAPEWISHNTISAPQAEPRYPAQRHAELDSSSSGCQDPCARKSTANAASDRGSYTSVQTDLGAKDIAKLLCLAYLLKP